MYIYILSAYLIFLSHYTSTYTCNFSVDSTPFLPFFLSFLLSPFYFLPILLSFFRPFSLFIVPFPLSPDPCLHSPAPSLFSLFSRPFLAHLAKGQVSYCHHLASAVVVVNFFQTLLL